MLIIEISQIDEPNAIPFQVKALHNLLLKLGVLNLTYLGKSTLGWNLAPAYAVDNRGQLVPK